MIGTHVGPIRIIGLLGQGGMGEVYLGYDDRLQRRVALKAVRGEKRLSAGSRERLLREARALSALDHPNICRIYDYAETPQCDFLLLELVEGLTLDVAMERGISRTRKLRIARDIVHALAAAHRRGIVHRDLKPRNVMLTAGGTVKILDFGLAQPRGGAELVDVVDIETADTLLYPHEPAAASAIAGTPLYMSPEQARGHHVTPASDLYSFGLLLQTLLTGRPPRPEELSTDALLHCAAAGEVLPMNGQPRDLTRLVARLTSIAPAERPTAVETLERLERIIATPARRVRMALVATVVLLFLAGTLRYTRDVTRARAEAERRRHQAEGLVAFMVSDLPKRLEPVGRLDVLDETATKALEYFASLRPDELSGDELHRHALALTQLGDVRMKQGKLPEALALFRQSLRFAQAAVADDPSREEWQLALSNSHFWIGDALRRQGDARGTLAHFQAYYQVSRQLADAHPNDPRYVMELSYGHSNLGSAFEALGDLARAGAEYRTAASIDRKRLSRNPADDQVRADLANSLNKLGIVLQSNGELAEARAAFEEDAAIRRMLVAAKPDDARRASRLATSLAYLGGAQLNTGRSAEAVATTREELAIWIRLAARDEQNLEWRRGRAVAQVRLSEALGGDAEGARLLDQAARTLTLLAAHDARPTWRRDLAAAHVGLARLAMRRGDRAQAAEHSARALALAEAARAAQASDVIAVRVLCAALVDLAELRPEVGRQHCEKVASLASGAPYSRDPRIVESLARALTILGRDREAQALVARLAGSGYRRPDFIARWQV
ncbi:MAG TPA: protein kinase [Thermoanaerobaculia bacterium]|jgi:serine/threonine-protein kinase